MTIIKDIPGSVSAANLDLMQASKVSPKQARTRLSTQKRQLSQKKLATKGREEIIAEVSSQSQINLEVGVISPLGVEEDKGLLSVAVKPVFKKVEEEINVFGVGGETNQMDPKVDKQQSITKRRLKATKMLQKVEDDA